MANQYKSFYLSDIVSTIDRVAVESLMCPCLENKKADGTQMTLVEVSSYNSLVAWHNEGVRELANQLKEALTKEENDD